MTRNTKKKIHKSGNNINDYEIAVGTFYSRKVINIREERL